MLVCFAVFELFGTIIGATDAVKAFMNYLFQKDRKPPWTIMKLRNRLLIRVTGISSAAIGLSFRTALSSCCGREIDAGDLGDGLPRGFLAGAIEKVRVALRLNWA